VTEARKRARRAINAVAWLLWAVPAWADHPPAERQPGVPSDDQITTSQPPDQSPTLDSPAGGEASKPAARDGAAVTDAIVVTATGTPRALGDTPAAITVLGAEDLVTSVALDDALRQVPGFTLFRRSGSRTANPTTQGASLRGLGGSGAGRALVLADGVPLADPFGGWVAWGRLPRAAVAQVEVLRGGASNLYGSSAVAGVVHLLRRDAAAGEVVADVSAGELDTVVASLWASRPRGEWAAGVAAEAFATAGHVPVAAGERGPVDRPAGTRHGTLEMSVQHTPETAGTAWSARAGWFDEERTNGTPLQDNATRIGHAHLGLDRLSGGGALALRAWAADHELTQTFSAVAADRGSERLVRDQVVAATLVGAAGRWTTEVSRRHTLLIGLEAERREGTSHERVFLPGGGILRAAPGGRQDDLALLVEDVALLSPRLSAVGGLRYDRWRNEPRDGVGARHDDMVSPRLAVHYQPRPPWRLFASAYRAFRAPTLNELYRGFRVGDVVTEPSPGLAAERATGAEAGATWTRAAAHGELYVRGTAFWVRLDDPIANVTLAVSDGLIVRQRRNLGRTRSRGAELEAEVRFAPRWRLGAGALWTAAEVVSFPADPAIEGRDVAQVPALQGSAHAHWQGDRADVALQGRWAGRQFDDDRNLFALEGFALLDARLGWRLSDRLTLYGVAENLFDEEVTVGRTPLRTVGSPRLLRLGARWTGGGAGATARRRP
jgi:outer membrane receptor protein involved in Fe transport